MIDFSEKNYANIAADMLSLVTAAVDKRDLSLINTAIGPAAYALEDAYLDLDKVQRSGHVQTAVGEDLDLVAQDVGIARYPASAAVRLGVFNTAVPIGSRFSTNEANPIFYTVTSLVSEGKYQLACETPGTIGNSYSGDLIAVTFIAGLNSAVLSDILISGSDEEGDDALRARCILHLSEKAFGGNVQSYIEFVGGISGVGGVQVYPTWNGGGTVKLSIVDSNYRPATTTLINAVQTAVDPTQNSGKGYGMAPIGAAVTVTTPATVAVNVSAAVTVASGYTLDQLKAGIESAISNYITLVQAAWAKPTLAGTTNYSSVIYRARITTAILSVTGVVNVTNLLLNGADAAIQLTESGTTQQTPEVGTVTLTNGN